VSTGRNDDHTRFDDLYRTTRADLLTYLIRRASSPEDAADTLSETYLIAWRKLHAVPPGEKARLWLFGVARNLLLKNAGRRRAGNTLVSRITDELRASPTLSPGKDPPAGHDRLAAALASLSELDREIITLTAWEGLAPKEIAAVIGSSANAVRIRLHRARARLQAELADGQPIKHDPKTMPAR